MKTPGTRFRGLCISVKGFIGICKRVDILSGRFGSQDTGCSDPKIMLLQNRFRQILCCSVNQVFVDLPALLRYCAVLMLLSRQQFENYGS